MSALSERTELAGETETLEFYGSAYACDAYDAARALESSLSKPAREWIENTMENGLLVAIEQCCADGVLLPTRDRLKRLERFDVETAQGCEGAIAKLSVDCAGALARVYWWVRIERAKRTGSADF